RLVELIAKELQALDYAMIVLIDDKKGGMLDALEERGQAVHTAVNFILDPVDKLGDHGLLRKGNRFYEGLVRVPLIISWPGHFQAGLVSEGLVELTDLAPTLLALGGAEAPDNLVGKSLLPILQGEAEPHTHREQV